MTPPGPTRILITGSRDWTDRQAIIDAINRVRGGVGWTWNIQIVHGGARGADTIAADFARCAGMRVELHRADWRRFGRGAGHRRNAEMVAAGADVCLAFPLGESRGTRGCIAAARAAGIPVIVHEGQPSPGYPPRERSRA